MNPAEVLHAFAQDFGGGPAEHAFRPGGPAGETHIGAPLDDGEGRVIDVIGKPLGEFAKLIFHVLAGGDVADDGDGESGVEVADDTGVHFRREGCSVLPEKGEFAPERSAGLQIG